MKSKIKIGDETISQTLNTEILARGFKSSELKEIWETYKRARKHDGQKSSPPTEFQKKIATEFKTGSLSYTSFAKKYKVQFHVIAGAVKKVAIAEYMQN